jgi:hypothetical protein
MAQTRRSICICAYYDFDGDGLECARSALLATRFTRFLFIRHALEADKENGLAAQELMNKIF